MIEDPKITFTKNGVKFSACLVRADDKFLVQLESNIQVILVMEDESIFLAGKGSPITRDLGCINQLDSLVYAVEKLVDTEVLAIIKPGSKVITLSDILSSQGHTNLAIRHSDLTMIRQFRAIYPAESELLFSRLCHQYDDVEKALDLVVTVALSFFRRDYDFQDDIIY